MVGSRVYVGGLPFGVRERDLEKFFKGFGRTRDILIKNGYGFVEFEDYRDADDAVYELNGKELLGERVVVEAARGMERKQRDRGRGDWRRPSNRQGGEKVSVERARGTPRGSDMWRDGGRYGPPPPPRRARSRDKYANPKYGPPTRTEFRLIVENLSSRISWQDLKDFMRQAGEVTYADAHKQRKNEGVVEFATHADLRNALDKLDNTELNGRRIRLTEDRRGGRGRRSRSRSSSSRSRSRSRRRSRSRSRSRSHSRRSSRSRSRSNSKIRVKKESKSPAAKSRSRSKQRSPSRSRSRSKSNQSRNSRHSRERSRSMSKDKKKSESRSPSPNAKREANGSDHNESVED